MYRLPMSEMPQLSGLPEGYRPGCPVLYHATFHLDKVGDTFLDMEKWGKGIVFVNGHNLGRYWNLGPQQTLYVPGCWLKEGKNEIVVFEQLNDSRQYAIHAVDVPVLDRLKTAETEANSADEVIARLVKENAALRQQVKDLQQQLAQPKKGKRKK